MLEVFRSGGDIHLATAMAAFQITDPKQVDKLKHRAPCKNVNFGIAYGQTEVGLYDSMVLTYAIANLDLPDWLTVDWCKEFQQQWFRLYPGAQRYFNRIHSNARRYEIVWSSFGRVRRIPEVRSVHERVRAAGLRQGGNMPIQGNAADTMKIGMARTEQALEVWRSRGVYAEALLAVHDELIIEADEDWAEEVLADVEEAMGRALEDTEKEEDGGFRFRVPLLADGKTMERWEKE
jgi:DNA polymerase-1